MNEDSPPNPPEGSFTLQIRVPTATLRPLMEEIGGLLERIENQGHARPFLESVLQSLKAAQVITQPEQVALRDRLKFAAEYADSTAHKIGAAGHPATVTLHRIARTLEEVLQGSDEEIRRRMPEVENLIERLSEFAVSE
ncbi:MAG: hypothetical protein KY468_14515 [Armatimonadetes bacterium]|nr:hypothetical protein [Armatimonadota bacterium]